MFQVTKFFNSFKIFQVSHSPNLINLVDQFSYVLKNLIPKLIGPVDQSSYVLVNFDF
jgi:hypothetical protein